MDHVRDLLPRIGGTLGPAEKERPVLPPFERTGQTSGAIKPRGLIDPLSQK